MTVKRQQLLGATIAILSVGLTACGGGSADGTSGPTEMNIETFGGALGETIASVAEGFEEKYDVKINWVEGSGVENVARIAASEGNQIYDAAFVPQQSHFDGSEAGLWAPLDSEVIDTADVYDVLMPTENNGVPVGLITTDLYYNTATFEEEGWEPPSSFDDLLNQEFCDRVGILDPNQTYGLYTILGLGGLTQEQAEAGELEEAWSTGLEKLATIKDCLPTIESSGGALEQKIQTGQYAIGTHGSVRILPIANAGVPVKAVIPEDGAFLTLSLLAAVKDAPHPDLAQKFLDWFLREESQERLMTETFYGPVISTVDVPQELAEAGVPSKETIDQLIIPDPSTVGENRSDWFDEFQRTMG